ncbi:iron-containing alcohol dehydrogenase [Candidatus Parcubacteria bacterium]|nr:iron-containing alcohol dehydrogenase [Candidatus Parcubacteria bacterium]
MDIKQLLKQRGIELKFISDSDLIFNELKGKEIITNDNDFTKNLLLQAGIKKFHLVKEASIKTAEEIKKQIKKQPVVGFGGGKAIDVAKKISSDLSLKFISIPTAPSHDGLVSKNFSLYNNKGKRETVPGKYPRKLIIPLNFWKNSEELKKSGICDLLSNMVALQDLSLAEKAGEKFSDFYKKLSFEAINRINTEDDRKLAEALILSGIAMEENSCYCSGSEHELERLFEDKINGKYLHGQLAGAGTLISAKVYSKYADSLSGLIFNSRNLFEDIKNRMENLGVYEFALIPLKDKKFQHSFLKEVSSIRPERYTLWNYIDSREIDWERIIEEITQGYSKLL